MPLATASPVATRITESLAAGTRVDREAGVVRGVKLIGFESKNGRRYPPSVLKSAVHLYEGAKVNLDHPESGDAAAARKYGERLGVIRSARFVEGKGIYGDFHFNPKHAVAEQFCWDAENNPESLGFSHNATLRLGDMKNGIQTIEEIVAIRSMDLVADPATTTSLFESYSMDDEQAMQAPGAGDPKSQVKDAFKQMIMAAVDDDSLDMKATMKKIGEIMKAQAKLMGVDAQPTSSEEGDDSKMKTGEEGTAFQLQIASLQQELEQYKAKERQAALVESIDKEIVAAGMDPKNTTHVSELFSKQLLATENEDDRKALIADRAALVGAKRVTESHSQPTYQPGTQAPVTESLDVKAFASRLLA